jgi:hypothetical protein
MKVSITVCDKCWDRERATTRFKITTDGRSASMDLCDEDAAPILSLMPKESTTPRRRRARKAGLVSMEEVEARKEAKKEA